jgi:hypothetical protein
MRRRHGQQGDGKRSPSPHAQRPDNQPSGPHGDDSDAASGGERSYTSSDLREYVSGGGASEPQGYAESPTIEKHQQEKRREHRRRSRRLVAQWRQRQKERAEGNTTLGSGGGGEDAARYVFFEDAGDEEAREKNEEEDKNARSHFVEYTDEEYEEMQRSLVREGMMSPPDGPDEDHWRLAEKHLSI